MDVFSNWCREQIAQLKEENEAIDKGQRLQLKASPAEDWIDTTQSTYDANTKKIGELERIVAHSKQCVR